MPIASSDVGNPEANKPSGSTAAKRISPLANDTRDLRSGFGYSTSMKYKSIMTKEEKSHLQRVRTTAESEAKSEELAHHGVKWYDFQDDADVQRSMDLTEDEFRELTKKQHDLAELFRTSVIKREEAERREALRA